MGRFLRVAWALVALVTGVPSPTQTFTSTESVPVPVWYQTTPVVASALRSWPRADTTVIPEVAASVARWSHETGLEPRLTLAVMRVENPWLKPDTVSYAGAVGLMQVTPRYWSDSYPHCGEDLTDVDVNVCKGAHILRFYLDQHGDFRSAMLAYNGCRSTYCEGYSDDVERFFE